jgi:hypothetical protein
MLTLAAAIVAEAEIWRGDQRFGGWPEGASGMSATPSSDGISSLPGSQWAVEDSNLRLWD